VIVEALDAERATLFLHDADTGELFSRVAHGDGVSEIRIPQSVGIAGSVFASGVAEIIDDAYQDARFNAEIDRVTGYCTRSENRALFFRIRAITARMIALPARSRHAAKSAVVSRNSSSGGSSALIAAVRCALAERVRSTRFSGLTIQSRAGCGLPRHKTA